VVAVVIVGIDSALTNKFVEILSMLQINAPEECVSASVACASPTTMDFTLSTGGGSLPPPPQMVGYTAVFVVFLPPTPTQMQGPVSLSLRCAAPAISLWCVLFIPLTSTMLFPNGPRLQSGMRRVNRHLLVPWSRHHQP
jgi:hypothetical protein